MFSAVIQIKIAADNGSINKQTAKTIIPQLEQVGEALDTRVGRGNQIRVEHLQETLAVLRKLAAPNEETWK